MNFQRFEFGDLAREQLRLYFLGDDQFVFQPLFFLLLEDQLLDRSGHRVERMGQIRELIVGAYWECDG